MNRIEVHFTLCDPPPPRGYNISYRVLGSDGAYINAGNFFISPAVFYDASNPFGTCYEGFVQADCGDTVGNPIAWESCEGDVLVTTLSYGVFQGNVLQPVTDQTMTSTFKVDNTHLNYYSQPTPIPLVLTLPLGDVSPGDVFPFILTPNITVISTVYDVGIDAWIMTGTVPGTTSNVISVVLPAFVSPFNLDGERMMNYTDTDFLEGAYYWEYQNFGNPSYNFGYGYRYCTLVRLRFKKIPRIVGTLPAHFNTLDYNIPPDLTVVSVMVSGAYYIVEFSFDGRMNHIFNLTTIPS